MARLGHARRPTTLAAINIFAAAALLSPVVLMSASVYAKSLPMQVYSTAVGEVHRVVLDERVSLQMNTGSSVTVTCDEICDVGLDHGEVLFEVDGETAQTLRVVAGETTVSAHAAQFSMRVQDTGDMELVVSAGQVAVGTTLIREHQWARISPDSMRVRQLTEAEVARRLEWTTGHLAFAGETLAEAVAEFNRYNARKLVIADRSISFIPIGGQFHFNDVQSFVDALRPLGVRGATADESHIQLMGAKGRN